ncbi:MAG: IS630 family transposase [Terracidiphilus sp.]
MADAPTDGPSSEEKSLHAQERVSKANLRQREEFLQQIGTTEAEKLIFLDESGVTTQMTRQWGRAPKGERVAEARPESHWKVLTTLGAMSLEGMVATMKVESTTDSDVFEAFLKEVLCPELKAGDVVVMDNLSVHKVDRVGELIEGAQARLLYLPPYSPDLNPIKKAWSKFKQFLRSAKARTQQALDLAVPEALKSITAENSRAWFQYCGYAPQN